MTKMKSVEPNGKHKALFDDLAATMLKHSQNLGQDEVLAILAYQTGMALALQDQHKMTPRAALRIVEMNIEAGNAHVITQAALGNLKP